MARIVAEKTICNGCGFDVRDGSSFCYNCGEQISVVEPERPELLATTPNSANGLSAAPQVIKTEASAEGHDVGQGEVQEVPPEADEKKNTAVAVPKKQRLRAYNRRPTTIEWSEREGSPRSYMVVSIVLFVMAAVLTLLALYIK